jgi:probable aminopeptidase NPEPL1
MFTHSFVHAASTHPSVLAILSYIPQGAADKPSVCMVGKGIVFDTGGLSIKSKEGMPGECF